MQSTSNCSYVKVPALKMGEYRKGQLVGLVRLVGWFSTCLFVLLELEEGRTHRAQLSSLLVSV